MAFDMDKHVERLAEITLRGKDNHTRMVIGLSVVFLVCFSCLLAISIYERNVFWVLAGLPMAGNLFDIRKVWRERPFKHRVVISYYSRAGTDEMLADCAELGPKRCRKIDLYGTSAVFTFARAEDAVMFKLKYVGV